MLRATATLLAAATKRSTGLTGLAVVPNAREVLIKLYEKTLDDVKVNTPFEPHVKRAVLVRAVC